jgi:hypothetical protein
MQKVVGSSPIIRFFSPGCSGPDVQVLLDLL